MRNDQIFVLLLVVLLPMSGCFDGGGVGEAEGAQDSDEASGGTTVVNHYYNNTTTSQNSQERVWHSSSDAVKYVLERWTRRSAWTTEMSRIWPLI